MSNSAIGFGIALVLLGLAGYFGAAMVSLTALIPAAFGLALAVLGFWARNERRRKVAMHAAVLVALLGFLGALRGVPKFFVYLSGGIVERPVAAVAQFGMALLCFIFIVLCVKSFVDARRSRPGT